MEVSPNILFAKLTPEARNPTRAHTTDAGFDLYSIDADIVGPRKISIINTGIQVAIPKGWVGLVCPRSGMAANYGVTVINSPGIIDSGYRGPIKVILTAETAIQVKPGDKVAQLVVVPYLVNAKNVPYLEDSDETDRGSDGFGSTDDSPDTTPPSAA